ncbi:hypothetical protein BIFGAL_04234 [Bifidobacterium gallicum DSM 20093 = LMG 11596]|uniref:Uncharacterized protein n=1 Tax=Bifidobacterium gallicum DSM 20093 = LMG 11596 TaxID=561180 RepID=D1NWI3_9BIFI|nr:hypothetical protein BIFGAL_04234 [Bifidobacterium gallicum DSM 20093 = LMG 11596]
MHHTTTANPRLANDPFPASDTGTPDPSQARNTCRRTFISP